MWQWLIFSHSKFYVKVTDYWQRQPSNTHSHTTENIPRARHDRPCFSQPNLVPRTNFFTHARRNNLALWQSKISRSVIGFQNNKETYRSNTSQSTKGPLVLQEGCHRLSFNEMFTSAKPNLFSARFIAKRSSTDNRHSDFARGCACAVSWLPWQNFQILNFRY